MIGDLNAGREFLFQPIPRPTESMRSLLSRLIAQNLLPIGIAGAGFLSDAAMAVWKVAHRAGWNLSDVHRRVAPDPETLDKHHWVAVGSSLIGKRCICVGRRRVCPLCMAQADWTPIAWELRANRACRVHACRLIDRCSQCESELQWFTHHLECNRCGLKWGDMSTQAATPCEVRLARWLHLGVVQSLDRVRADRRTNQGLHVRLDKLLLLLDVLRHELLPRWLPPSVMESHGSEWTLRMLQDKDLRSWLWHEVFLHLAKDPMTLAQGLVPTGSPLVVSSFFNGFMPQAPVPGYVVDGLRDLGERRQARKLKPFGRFDVRVHGVRGSLHVPERSTAWGPAWDGEEEDIADGTLPALGRDTYAFMELSKPRQQALPLWGNEHEWAR